MVIFHSVRLFLWGITKRCYYWAPFLFLDLFDIYEIYIKPRLPADWGGGIVLPAWWGFALFSLMLLWAAIMTYHELRTEKDTLVVQLDDKMESQLLLEPLETLHRVGNALLIKRIENDEEYKQWKENNKKWKDVTLSFIQKNISELNATRFDVAKGKTTPFVYEHNEDHRRELNFLDIRIEILEEIIARIQK